MKISTSFAVLAVALTLSACSSGPNRRNVRSAPPPERPAFVPDGAGVAERYAAALELMQRHQDTEAIKQMRALTETGSHIGPLVNLGILYARQDQLNGAVDMWRRALRLSPGQPLASHWLASVLRRQGQTQEAERVLLAALQVEPDNPATHRNLAVLYELNLHLPERAVQHYRRYQELSSGDTLVVEAWIRALQASSEGVRLAEMQP